MKSARVILTAVAAVGMAARGQQGGDPCDAATFNSKVCKPAIRHNGYCSGGTWVPMAYSQSYPDYFDSYLAYLSGGGAVAATPKENCRRPSTSLHAGHGISRGGFGRTGAGHHAGG